MQVSVVCWSDGDMSAATGRGKIWACSTSTSMSRVVLKLDARKGSRMQTRGTPSQHLHKHEAEIKSNRIPLVPHKHISVVRHEASLITPFQSNPVHYIHSSATSPIQTKPVKAAKVYTLMNTRSIDPNTRNENEPMQVMTYKHFENLQPERDWRVDGWKNAYSMKANAAATPARLRPAWRLDAAPVLSGMPVERVAVPEPEALGLRLAGTDMDLVGWTMVELPAGTPVLRTSDEVLVMMVELLALLEGAGLETGYPPLVEEALLDGTGVLTG